MIETKNIPINIKITPSFEVANHPLIQLYRNTIMMNLGDADNTKKQQVEIESLTPQIIAKLENTADIDTQSELLGLLLELDVKDRSRIGEPIFETLKYDWKTKATGEFEFIEGDRNLAIALLQLINEDEKFQSFISQLCEKQKIAGIATPFDYRRLTLLNTKEFKNTSVDEWITYFRSRDHDQLEQELEVGKSFSSTREKRFSDEREGFIKEKIGTPCHSLLDIGGSTGVSSIHIANLLSIPHNMVTVTDYRTPQELQQCFYGGFTQQEDISYILGEQGDITKHTPNDKIYELVTINNVLVHIIDKKEALKNILPRIAIDGFIIISGGYNTNPPKKGFWLFRKSSNGLKLIE